MYQLFGFTAFKIELRVSGAERKYHNSERTTLEAMAAAEDGVELKRKADNNADGDGDAEEDEWVGPMPCEAIQPKKRKGVLWKLGTLLY